MSEKSNSSKPQKVTLEERGYQPKPNFGYQPQSTLVHDGFQPVQDISTQPPSQGSSVQPASSNSQSSNNKE